MFIYNKKNLPSHRYIDFESDAGVTSVNVGINEVVQKFGDISVGSGTFEISVNHIYSSNMHVDNTGMGRNWKLNIEQYIYPYNTSYGYGFNSGDYIYVDGDNIIHQFVKYNGNKYYDACGTGLILCVGNSYYEIRDEQENSMLFDSSGRLTTIYSKGTVSTITKIIEYNTLGYPSKYYDSRCVGSKERYISFEYSENRLSKMSYIIKGTEQESIHYIYNNGDLKGYYRFVGKTLVNYGMHSYDLNHILKFVTGTTGQALKIDYSNYQITIKKGVSKVLISSFDTLTENMYLEAQNYVNSYSPIIGDNNEERKYLGDNLVLGEMISLFENVKDDTSIINDFLIFPEIADTKYNTTIFNYQTSYSEMIQCKGIKHRYYLNTDKEVLSLFEVKGNDLLTTTRDEGYPLMREMEKSNSSYSLNRKQILSGTMGKGYYCISQNEQFINEEFVQNGFQNYYASKGKNCNNYTVTFWVRHQASNCQYVRAVAKATSRFCEVESKINIDPKGLDAWRYVEIPFSFNNIQENKDAGIYNLLVKLESDVSASYEITNVRIKMSSRTLVALKEQYIYNPDLTQVYQYKLETNNGTQYLNMTSADFVTHQDIFKTLLNKGKNNGASFDFIYNNNRKRIANVNNIKVRYYEYESKEYAINGFNNVDFSTYDYTHKKVSSNHYTFKDNKLINMEFVDEGINTTCQDLQGRTLYSTNYLDKTIVNSYDNYGNLLSTMTAKASAFDSNYKFISKDSSGKSNHRFYLLNVYDDESGNGEYRENIIGVKNEELYVETKYSSSKPSLVSEISSGDLIKEKYQYDSINRLVNISSGNLSNHIFYNEDGLINSIKGNNNHYVYAYNNFGEINTISIKNGSNTQKLFETDNNMETKKSIKISNPLTNSYKEIYYDIYDRPTIIKHSDSNENFESIFTCQSQNDKINLGTYVGYMDESPALANVKSLYDGYTKFTTDFEYDMDNNKVGLVTKDINSNIHLSVKNDNAVEITYNVGGLVVLDNITLRY